MNTELGPDISLSPTKTAEKLAPEILLNQTIEFIETTKQLLLGLPEFNTAEGRKYLEGKTATDQGLLVKNDCIPFNTGGRPYNMIRKLGQDPETESFIVRKISPKDGKTTDSSIGLLLKLFSPNIKTGSFGFIDKSKESNGQNPMIRDTEETVLSINHFLKELKST